MDCIVLQGLDCLPVKAELRGRGKECKQEVGGPGIWNPLSMLSPESG